jgi:hypothetical protein
MVLMTMNALAIHTGTTMMDAADGEHYSCEVEVDLEGDWFCIEMYLPAIFNIY